MADDRKTVQVRITEDARSGLHAFCRRHGLTLTALMEAFGEQCGADRIDQDRLIEEARAVAYEHHNRRWSG